MRTSIAALSAAAALAALAGLASCSDHAAAPTAPNATQKVGASGIHDGNGPDTTLSRVLDPSSVPERLEAMMSAHFGKVLLPSDGFSRSADAVHPDIVCPGEAWNTVPCWLLYTPYKGGDNTYENPSFLYAANDTSWGTPVSVANPIIAWPGAGKYNSDPDHAFDPANQRLVQIYRVVADGYNNIMIMSTSNARQWTAPQLAFREPDHDAVSPALVIASDRTASIWYVKSGSAGCSAKQAHLVVRTARPAGSDPFETATWSAPVTTDLAIPGYVPWHLDVEALPNGRGYIALVAAFPVGQTCGSSDLWIATSDDGLHWRSSAVPLFWRGMQIARSRNMSTWYRGTIRYDATTDVIDLWPSALAGANWTIYHASAKLQEMLSLFDQATPEDLSHVTNRMAHQAIPRAALPMP